MGRTCVRLTLIAVVIGWALPAGSNDATSNDQADRSQMPAIVMQIKRADFEDDRAALNTLFQHLTPYVKDPQVATFAHYWRGFALWRRALNGINDSSKEDELDADLTRAVQEFAAADARPNGFVEAEIGEAACEGTLLFLHHADTGQLQGRLARDAALLKDLQEKSPDNPRFLWVLGASLWSRPAAAGGNRAAAIRAYERGLRLITDERDNVHNPLEASWGEAELLMSLSWSGLHQTPPDLEAAEHYAQQALRVAPNWHFVRGVLVPQIAKARADTTANSVGVRP